jgi:hypothetical protein
MRMWSLVMSLDVSWRECVNHLQGTEMSVCDYDLD